MWSLYLFLKKKNHVRQTWEDVYLYHLKGIFQRLVELQCWHTGKPGTGGASGLSHWWALLNWITKSKYYSDLKQGNWTQPYLVQCLSWEKNKSTVAKFTLASLVLPSHQWWNRSHIATWLSIKIRQSPWFNTCVSFLWGHRSAQQACIITHWVHTCSHTLKSAFCSRLM